MLDCFFFFFQAEDGIRDIGVTGVQTCALPIYAALDPQRSFNILREYFLDKLIRYVRTEETHQTKAIDWFKTFWAS